jgi:hypothetical protein
MHVGDFVGRPENSLRIVLKRRVCATCNGTWMKRMDDRFVGVMREAVRRNAEIDLSNGDQEIVSTWATKVALLIELFLHDLMRGNPNIEIGSTFVPADNLHDLNRSRRPPEGTTVWLGAVRHETLHPFSSIGGAIFGGPAGPLDGIARGELCGYQSIFNLRGVVFGVRGWANQYVDNEPQGMADPEHTAPGKTIQIWPRISPIRHWPPPAGELVVAEIKALAWTDEEPRRPTH